ncbi:hypothetical protein C0Q60_13840 [Streptomyces albidoflavus]|nr:hypothetical protein C0Q61_12890 [Streptomyces albidoflavus]RZD80748.1 hypothetical protein C0Q60_13840 [Streptomyces albidoflavus]RZD86773.1 hypothetical protein C0Q63_13200 [Streptomyces albidoflavus]RZD98318.1 hypothetical protein C0Q62_13720 [Streptomyces albidoflavus]
MISGHHISRSSPDRSAGTRTKLTSVRRRPSARVTARSASEYSGTSTRSCASAAPANHTTTSHA